MTDQPTGAQPPADGDATTPQTTPPTTPQQTVPAAPVAPVATEQAAPAAGSDQPTAPPAAEAPAKSRWQGLAKRIGAAALAMVAFFGFRAFTADDGTHGITVGQCVAAEGTDDFKKVDCGASDALGKVTFIDTDAETSESAALSLCEKHGAEGAFTSAVREDAKGTVICVADLK